MNKFIDVIYAIIILQVGLHTWLPDNYLKNTSYFIKRFFATTNLFYKNPGKNRLPETPISDFLSSFIIGLIVSGCLIIRQHKDILTARISIKFTVTKGVDNRWLDYLYNLLKPYCYKSWRISEEFDKRFNPRLVSYRATLESATIKIFYPFYTMFWETENNKGIRTLTVSNLKYFNNISLAAWIIATGYWLSKQEYSTIDGLALPVPYNYTSKEHKLLLIRLKELGIVGMLRHSQDRNRGKIVILIPRGELSKLNELVGHLLISSKLDLIKG